MNSKPNIKNLSLPDLADYILDGLYESIQSHPGLTTSEALCRYLVASDIHYELQNMIQTGAIRTKAELKRLAGEYVTERLVIRMDFEDVMDRIVCEC